MKDDQASSTALSVLQGIIYVSNKPQFANLVSTETANAGKKILAATRQGQKRLKQLSNPLFVAAVPLMEKLMMPGITLHYALRKKYIEDTVLNAINDGCTQVLNLGAGFDTLAYRFSKQYPNINFIELDHPATQQLKSQALAVDNSATDNLHLISVDFTHQTLAQVLEQANCFYPDKPTICIIEGVLMYLTPEQIYDLFLAISGQIKAPTSIVFTAVEPASANKGSYGPLLNIYLKIKGEPLNWLCNRQDLPTFMQKTYFEIDHIANFEAFKSKYVPEHNGDMHRNEYIALVTKRT
ncbi:hypothetical protein C2869_01585 [Saccharobesus litoralis]|uniref:S-adenosyl-L-methionine-dependent methyltransferase n=1 Tax=Saccharobesus litoralis TaxID=2172099 RepID=A0A2S0VLX0_9ALTE|nr:class I SAM-dependent methyltransferase [Saccharobesus litoralis]AWB65214.1 hypothetical protein C2869_01585 [Saccharobesus litoralis]